MALTAELYGKKVNHSTRKTFATTLRQSDRPITEVAQLGGWKSVSTLTHYNVPSIVAIIFELVPVLCENIGFGTPSLLGMFSFAKRLVSNSLFMLSILLSSGSLMLTVSNSFRVFLLFDYKYTAGLQTLHTHYCVVIQI
jgi:hypothetical protein